MTESMQKEPLKFKSSDGHLVSLPAEVFMQFIPSGDSDDDVVFAQSTDDAETNVMNGTYTEWQRLINYYTTFKSRIETEISGIESDKDRAVRTEALLSEFFADVSGKDMLSAAMFSNQYNASAYVDDICKICACRIRQKDKGSCMTVDQIRKEFGIGEPDELCDPPKC